MKKKTYSLRKSRSIFNHINTLYRQKWKKLTNDQLQYIEQHLEKIEDAFLANNREEASHLAHKIERFEKDHFKKNLLDHARELSFALIVALIIATLIRQMVAEPMEIPTGSMRDTFKEQDRLIVSKTNFGINIPLTTGHFTFDPSLVQRTGIFIWRPENIDLPDTDTSYFGIPGKKRYIKRCMGKPGDSLYFYGGQLYGVDENGQSLLELRTSPWIKDLEHIPFLNFEGRVSTRAKRRGNQVTPEFFLSHMKQTIAKVAINTDGKLQGQIFVDGQWRSENLQDESSEIHSYFDFFGIKNYAMARLLDFKQLCLYSPINEQNIPNAKMYLELRHHPDLSGPALNSHSTSQISMSPSIHTYTTAIPLEEKHLSAIMDSMYTTRFVINNEHAHRYSASQSSSTSSRPTDPKFPGVKDGTYEFYHGTAYKIGFGGIATALPQEHPLYVNTPQNIQRLYNLGIEIHTAVSPSSKYQGNFPSRYVYFKNGDLHTMGAPILKSTDAVLLEFLNSETKAAERSPSYRSYIPFQDYGPPLKNDGSLDVEFIRRFGVTLPPKMYLALGDNHASSLDSRYFGFVPEENIRGGAGPILWPPGERWGFSKQKNYPWFTIARVIVWSSLLGIIGFIYLYDKWYCNRRRFKKLSPLKPSL